jgi:plasmid maintenance system antidote protein VapI
MTGIAPSVLNGKRSVTTEYAILLAVALGIDVDI